MLDKVKLSQLFLEQANLPNQVDIRHFMRDLWVAPYSRSLQLSKSGHIFLSKTLQLQYYDVSLKQDITYSPKFYLSLNYLSSPFYLQTNNISCYGEEDSMMLILLDGDLETYLINSSKSD
jgi:hypothetical protein